MAENAGMIKVLTQDVAPDVTNYSKRICVVGIKSTAGTAGNFELVQDIRSLSEMNASFGRNSHIAQSLKHLIEFNEGRALDHNLFIDAIGINQIGTKAIGSITFNGTATKDSDALITITKEYAKKLVSILNGNTAEQVATNFNSVLNADLDLCVVSEIDGTNPAKLNLTATNEGKWANYINIIIQNLPTGITATVTQLTGGSYTGLTTLENLKIAMNNEKFDAVIIEADLMQIDSSLKTFFNDRATKIINKDKTGVVWMYKVDAIEDNFINNYKTEQFAISLAMKQANTLPSIILAEVVGKIMGSLVLNYDCSDYLPTNSGRGGPVNANRAINEIRLQTISALTSNFTNTELANLKTKGFLTVENSDGNRFAMITGNMSMYQETIDGQEPTLNRINDLIRKQIASGLVFEATKVFKNKVVRTGKVHDYDITKDDIKATYDEVLVTLTNQSEDGVVHGYYQDSPIAIAKARAKIESSVDRQAMDGRTITVESVNEIAKTIENVLTSLSFK